MALATWITKKRYIISLGLFFVLVGRIWYLHYERHQCWERLKKNYQTEKTGGSNKLRPGEVVRFLRDNGVNITREQFNEWVGKIDNEHDGFDEGEVVQALEYFEDFTDDVDVDEFTYLAWGPFGVSTLADMILTGVAALGFFVLLQNADQLERRWAATAFGSAVKLSRMNKKRSDLHKKVDEITAERQGVETKLATLEVEAKEAVSKYDELQTEYCTIVRRASVTSEQMEDAKKAQEEALAEKDKAEALLAQHHAELEQMQKNQTEAENQLAELRRDTEKHMAKALMSTTKLRAMQKCLRGIDAVGAASPFKGAGGGNFQDKGATVGFSVKGVDAPSLQRQKSINGASIDTVMKRTPTGFLMESFVFGYPDPLRDDIILYEVNKRKDLLGHGADCAYRCRDIATRQEYALKMYDLRGSAQRRQILNDLHTNQQIGDHQHIVQYHQVVETEDHIFVLMELIDGIDLFQHIVDRNGLDERRAARIFQQVCKAVQFVHSADVVHGDIKPENVMVMHADTDEPHIKLIDFGFSCFLNTGEDTRGSAVHDTYSTPEGLENKPVTRASDLWRLGCMLYVMVMATVPFDMDVRDARARREGRFQKYPKWQTLSPEVQDVITGLLKGPEADRLQLDQVLNHPWLQQHCDPASPRLLGARPCGANVAPPCDAKGASMTATPKGDRSVYPMN